MRLIRDVRHQGEERRKAKEVLNSLAFSAIFEREERILRPHSNTFEWIFKTRNDCSPWTSLPDWVDSDSKIYWISGKPGSGKSTVSTNKSLLPVSNDTDFHRCRTLRG